MIVIVIVKIAPGVESCMWESEWLNFNFETVSLEGQPLPRLEVEIPVY